MREGEIRRWIVGCGWGGGWGYDERARNTGGMMRG